MTQIITAPLWSSIGPTRMLGLQPGLSCAGRIDNMAFSPNSNGFGLPAMYLGTPGGGVWRSTDFTTKSPSWWPLTDHLPDLTDAQRVNLNKITSIAVDP